MNLLFKKSHSKKYHHESEKSIMQDGTDTSTSHHLASHEINIRDLPLNKVVFNPTYF